MQDVKQELTQRFEHRRLTQDQRAVSQELREQFQNTASLLADKCPRSRELSLAITKLEESMMWANKALAFG